MITSTKWAVIRNSNKPAEELPTKSLKKEINKLHKEGYEVIDKRS